MMRPAKKAFLVAVHGLTLFTSVVLGAVLSGVLWGLDAVIAATFIAGAVVVLTYVGFRRW